MKCRRDELINGSSVLSSDADLFTKLVTFNENESFASLAQLNDAINTAITEANGGKSHPAGHFTIEMSSGTAISWPVSGKELVNTNWSSLYGSEGWKYGESTKELTFVPFFLRMNRGGNGGMRVWVKRLSS